METDSKDISNTIVKNYKELCSLLGWEETTGNAKIAQLKLLGKMYDYKQEGHKFIIKDKNLSVKNTIYINKEYYNDFYWTNLLNLSNKNHIYNNIYKYIYNNNILYNNIYNIIYNKSIFNGQILDNINKQDVSIEEYITSKEIKDIEQIVELMETNDKNSKYIGNNIIIYLYYMKHSNNNEYITYTSKQMKDFGFIREDLYIDYSNSTPKEGLDPLYRNIPIELKEEIDILTNKKSTNIFQEVYNFLLDRFKRLMKKSYEKLLDVRSKEDVIDFSTADITKFLEDFKNTTNLMHMRDGIFGVLPNGEEKELSRQEETEYIKIKNSVFSFFNITGNRSMEKNVKSFKGKIGQIYANIQKQCQDALGYSVCSRKIFFSPLKDLKIFNISEEDMLKAKRDNNEKIKQTALKFFSKKYSENKKYSKAVKKVVEYFTEI